MKNIFLLLAIIAFEEQSKTIAQSFDPAWANKFQNTINNSVSSVPYRGATVSVFVPGQGMWTGVSGFSSPGKPINPEMRFGIGSITKIYMAVSMLKLQEEGVLDLDDQLSQWLPAYPNINPSITIRQLLSNTSGLADLLKDNPPMNYDSVWADTTRIWHPSEVISTIKPPLFLPGHGYYYSNTNYILAGLIMEAATGRTLVQNLHTYIFDPLNLDSTFVGILEAPNGPVAHEWIYDNTLEISNSPMPSIFSMMAASGGIFSTSGELVQFFNALFNGEILEDTSMQELLNFETTSNYGLGMITTNFGRPFIFGQGAMYGYESICVYDPQTKSILCVLTNGSAALIEPLFIQLLDVLTSQYPKKPNDAGITSILKPQQNICKTTFAPSVSLHNFGSSKLTSVNLTYFVDGISPTTFNWVGSLNTGSSATIELPSFTFTNGFHTLTCFTSHPNGVDEGYTDNDTAKSEFIINTSPALSTPILESFEGLDFPPTGWITGSLSPLEWGQSALVSATGNSCAARGNVADFGNIGTAYDLYLPIINLSGITNPRLYFKHAYTNYPGRNDSLRIQVSTDCGATWKTIFYKGGSSLRTISTASTQYFYPTDPGQWRKDTVSLAFINGEALIRFRCINYNGNNLFIDDIQIDQTAVSNEEVLIESAGFNIYPNPATDHLTVIIPGLFKNAVLTISDITGKIIYKTVQKQTEKIEINTSDFTPGIYLVQIQSSNYMETKKIILVK